MFSLRRTGRPRRAQRSLPGPQSPSGIRMTCRNTVILEAAEIERYLAGSRLSSIEKGIV
jgi:hypothetical protein